MEAIAHKTRKGFNLIEAAIVLAVVGGVIGAIWYAAAKFYEDYKVNKTFEELALIVKDTQKLISIRDAESIFSTLGVNYQLNNTLKEAGVFPKSWINGNTIIPPIGGYVHVYNNLYNLSEQARFDFRFHSVSNNICIKLLVKAGSMSGSGTLYTSTGNGLFLVQTYASSGGLHWGTTTLPVSPEEASTACNTSIAYVRFVFLYTRNN